MVTNHFHSCFSCYLYLKITFLIGVWRDRMWPDGWTAVTADGKRSAQFEHTLLVNVHFHLIFFHYFCTALAAALIALILHMDLNIILRLGGLN